MTATEVLQPDRCWARECIQARADDVVVAAAVFKPNAPGNFELSPSGFGDRQMLKACCAYLGERILLGVTPLDVLALELFAGGRLTRAAGRWPRHDLAVTRVSARRRPGNVPDPDWPAMLVCRRSGRPLAELQALRADPDAGDVLELLLSGRSVVDGGKTGSRDD